MLVTPEVKMKRLNVATYLVPSISIEFFEALMVYFERRLKCHTTLRYESRWEGPPKERADIFDEDGIDLGKLHRAHKNTSQGKFCSIHDRQWLSKLQRKSLEMW